jgi:hypothetical protein
MKKISAPGPGLIWLCALACAPMYAVIGWGGLVASVVCLSSFEVIRRLFETKPKGWAAVFAALGFPFLLALCLAGCMSFGLGLFLDFCYAIIYPKIFFSLLLWSGLVYLGLRMLSFPEKASLLWRSEAVALILIGLAMSPGSWQRLHAAADSRPSSLAKLGWRFRFSGPEGGAEKPRFYVKTKDRAKPYKAVDLCPAGTRPYAAERVEGGTLCR